MDNTQSNNSAAFHPFGTKKFCVHLGKKVYLKIYFFLGRGSVGLGPGGQKIVICKAISQDVGLKFFY